MSWISYFARTNSVYTSRFCPTASQPNIPTFTVGLAITVEMVAGWD